MTELALAVFASETGTHLLHPPLNRRWYSHLRSFDGHAYEQRLAARGLRFLPRTAPEFPPLLRAIHDPPPGLFVRGAGDIGLLSRAAVAVVGARACSGYGASVGRSLGRELTRGGLLVVSGMARGVDAEAHRGALEAGGPTVAVLGCGIDRDYPAAHAELARRIAATGLLVSEYAPGVEPAPWRFPARKRGPPAAMPIWLNHACRPCRTGRQIACWCGLGVVSAGREDSQKRRARFHEGRLRCHRGGRHR
jgi:predicted Rossmann fold nucleotide-binding protein DprA/Smf involved in DNA uptake